MPSIRVPQQFNSGTYFFTLTIKNWYYILDRYHRWSILSDSLKFFQREKELKLRAFVFMINHIHLIVEYSDMIGFIRDFKKFTTYKLLENIKRTEPAVLKLFQNENSTYSVWGKTNMPEYIETEKFFFQKVNYIQNNPIKREYVSKAEDWYWSSANPYCDLEINKFEEEKNETVQVRDAEPTMTEPAIE